MIENLFHVLRFSSTGVFAALGHWTPGQIRSGRLHKGLEVQRFFLMKHVQMKVWSSIIYMKKYPPTNFNMPLVLWYQTVDTRHIQTFKSHKAKDASGVPHKNHFPQRKYGTTHQLIFYCARALIWGPVSPPFEVPVELPFEVPGAKFVSLVCQF